MNFKDTIKIFLAGALSSLAFAPFNIFPAWLISILFLVYKIFKTKTANNSFFIGWVWGFGHFVSNLYWVSYGPAAYFDDFWWAIPFALTGIPFILSFFTAFASYISWYFKNNDLYFIIFMTIWVLFEWLREWLFTGFPWTNANYTLHVTQIWMQTSAIIGPYGQSFISILPSSILFYLFINKNSFFLKRYSFITLVCYSLITIYGIEQTSSKIEFSNIKARIVQPSIMPDEKWSNNKFIESINKLSDLSKLEPKDGIDLVIWPEAAIVIPPVYKELIELLKQALPNDKAILLTGGVNHINDKIYSSAYSLDINGNINFNYNKMHLVPFGEYVPFSKYLSVKKITPGITDYSAGDDLSIMPFKGFNIRMLICYEAIFPSEIKISQENSLIVHITNDAYYKNTTGPYQHLEISRARAVENRVPLIRAGNHGISAFIDQYGRIIKQTSINEITALDCFIPENKNNISFYAKYGNLLAVIFILSLWLLLIFLIKI